MRLIGIVFLTGLVGLVAGETVPEEFNQAMLVNGTSAETAANETTTDRSTMSRFLRMSSIISEFVMRQTQICHFFFQNLKEILQTSPMKGRSPRLLAVDGSRPSGVRSWVESETHLYSLLEDLKDSKDAVTSAELAARFGTEFREVMEFSLRNLSKQDSDAMENIGQRVLDDTENLVEKLNAGS